MLTQATLLPETGLELYGTSLATYKGKGDLTLSSGRVVTCQFVAGQLESGKTLLLCAALDPLLNFRLPQTAPAHFEGATEDGLAIRTQGDLVETNYLPQAGGFPATWLALRVSHLKVSQPQPRQRKRLIYLLTNVSGVDSPILFSLSSIALELRPIEAASTNLKRVQVLRSVLPTAEIAITSTVPIDQASRVVDEACYLLSLALGTKVQWISITEETKSHKLICRHHSSRVTKRYGSLHILNKDAQELSGYLRQAADGRFTRGRERAGMSYAVIDTYLDAKSEGDFLQVRALKLVIAVEMLKAGYVATSGMPSFILPLEDFDAAVPKLKKALKANLPNSKKEERWALYMNTSGLNRIPFSCQLRQLCAEIGMPVSPEEIDRFVASRNKLVHEGFFYCERATDREKMKIQPLDSVYTEWFWLLHFVDRLFLRAIDYEGPYIDWSTPESPATRQLARGTLS